MLSAIARRSTVLFVWLALGCDPGVAQDMKLAEVAPRGVLISADQTGQQGPLLDLTLDTSGTSSVCPVLSSAVATLNGAPLDLTVGGGVSQPHRCYQDLYGRQVCYEQECQAHTWSTHQLPEGPLHFLIEDDSESIEITTGDLGTLRTLRTDSVVDGAAGAVTVDWQPASDLLGGNVPDAVFWTPQGNNTMGAIWEKGIYALDGGTLTVEAASATAMTEEWPAGGSGTLTASMSLAIPVTQCETHSTSPSQQAAAVPCSALLEATPSAALVWHAQ